VIGWRGDRDDDDGPPRDDPSIRADKLIEGPRALRPPWSRTDL